MTHGLIPLRLDGELQRMAGMLRTLLLIVGSLLILVGPIVLMGWAGYRRWAKEKQTRREEERSQNTVRRGGEIGVGLAKGIYRLFLPPVFKAS